MREIEVRKKEQKKALQRLQDLDNLTKNKSAAKTKTEESDKISLYSGTQSTTNSLSLSTKNNQYAEIYDPYKVKKEKKILRNQVRKEIEEKYTNGPKKSQVLEKYKKDNADYTKSRLKLVQKNILGQSYFSKEISIRSLYLMFSFL